MFPWFTEFFKNSKKKPEFDLNSFSTSSTHYSDYALEGPRLIAYGKIALQKLKEDAGDRKPMIVFTGLSGISLGTAILMMAAEDSFDIMSIYVRKEDEVSHGYDFESSYPSSWSIRSAEVIYFVDDFVSSGATARYAKKSLIRHCPYTKVLPWNMLLADEKFSGTYTKKFEGYDKIIYIKD